jgi:hypothetical protein
MGRIIIKSESEYIPGVYSTRHITCRYYCDKCGSYKISSCRSIKIWFPAGLFILLLLFLNKTISLSKITLLDAIFIGIFFIIAFILSIYESGHKCVNCRFEFISEDNILNYPEFSNYNLDIPAEYTHCHTYIVVE